eukprot:2944421-Heterocapsa_arctica.AAC.1
MSSSSVRSSTLASRLAWPPGPPPHDFTSLAATFCSILVLAHLLVDHMVLRAELAFLALLSDAAVVGLTSSSSFSIFIPLLPSMDKWPQ